MSLESIKEWLCPLCGIVTMKQGTTCAIWPECGNEPHLTGRVYTDKINKETASPSLGISKISDE